MVLRAAHTTEGKVTHPQGNFYHSKVKRDGEAVSWGRKAVAVLNMVKENMVTEGTRFRTHLSLHILYQGCTGWEQRWEYSSGRWTCFKSMFTGFVGAVHASMELEFSKFLLHKCFAKFVF